MKRDQIAGLRFNRQKPIGKYIADFYCNKLKLIIEIDGDRHYKNKEPQKDKLRDQYFKEQGIKVLRFTNYEIYKNIESVLDKIWIEIEEFVSPPRE